MRVTNTSMINSYLKDVQNNLQSMNKINTQINTSKQVNTLSDDPFKAVKIMNIQCEINNVEKYNNNCDEITGWLDTTDEALDQIGTLTSEIKTLLTSVQGTFGEYEVKAVQTQINEKMKQIGEAMNTTYAGKFVFGGSITDEPPVKIEPDPVTGLVKLSINKPTDENGDIIENSQLDEKLQVKISDGITLDYNLTINNITSTSTSISVEGTENKNGLEILNDVVTSLGSEPFDIKKVMEQTSKISKDLDTYMNDILNNRSLVGAKTNTVESIKTSNEDGILQMKGTFSLMQDVDVAEAFMKLQEAQMVYTAGLQVGGKLIQPTLLDYLR